MDSVIYPSNDRIRDPLIDLTYSIQVDSEPASIWPWLIQMGYHRGGWYIDTWWDRFAQDYLWPHFVPKEAQGNYLPPADHIIPELQSLQVGDRIPDGPPGSAYYIVEAMEENRFLALYSTSHFKYLIPSFLSKTKLEPYGEFSWMFLLEPIETGRTRVVSRWSATGGPSFIIKLWLPLVRIADHFHQPEILKGLKRRVESSKDTKPENLQETGYKKKNFSQ